MGLLKGGYRRVVFVVAALTIEGLAVYVDSLSTSVYTLNISTFAIYSQTQKSPSPLSLHQLTHTLVAEPYTDKYFWWGGGCLNDNLLLLFSLHEG